METPGDIQSASPPSRGWRWLKALIGILFGAIALIVLWQSVDYRDVAAHFAKAAVAPLIVGLIAYGLDFVLRAYRFKILLEGTRHEIPLLPTVAPFVASFGINDILPLRLGDGFRVFWFHDRLNLPLGRVLGAMLLERLLDLVTIVLLACLALMMIDADVSDQVLERLRWVMIICSVGGILILFSPLALSRFADRLRQSPRRPIALVGAGIASMSDAIKEAGTLGRMSRLIVFSLLIWLLESVVALAVWVSLDGPASEWLKPFFAFTVAMLGTLVPALPGHFGSFDYFGVLSFEAVGVERDFAAAVILLLHLLLWLPTALFAVVWLILAPKSGKRVFKTAS
ncbi:MAG: flippase-like domain-containing protein [Porphyrobacter sp.]|nr:flippase-like domain-containing protein [Porphyrobacter sp.]